MRLFAANGNHTLRRTLAVILPALAIVIAGTWAAVKIATDHLLYENATSAAKNWARLLADSVPDLEQIANGESPSSASMTFFEWAQKAGQVFRYEIYNRQGYSQLISEGGIEQVSLSTFSADAVRALASDRPVVTAQRGQPPERPEYYARAFVPVKVDGRPAAIVAAYVDQTDQQARFYKTGLIAGASLCLLTGLAFGIPAFAWYRRTEEKQVADRRIRYLAHHDPLTGLTNRAQLVEKLQSAIAALPLRGESLALHFVDLDRFKEINDAFGHDGGDYLLKMVATRLREAARIGDEIARLGGDEFVVVQMHVRSRQDAEEFGRRLAAALAAPLYWNDQEITTTASVGIALAPKDGRDPERLLKSADLALYAGKAAGRNCVRFFLPEMDAELQARIALEQQIRKAVHNESFVLHYQPIHAVTDKRLVGFEALIRMPSDDGELIQPDVFIPVAEEMRLIDKISNWVLHEACRTAMSWPEHMTVAVNLSPSQFSLGSVSAIVAAALKDTGIEAHRLELEITETLLLGDPESVLKELQTLKSMGVAIVMDDFGTGYSSLSYLWRFPFNKIKIDRSFIQAFGSSTGDAETVIKTIIALGRQLHMHVTVEGVESDHQMSFLKGVDADHVQGFYFSGPVPATEVAACIMRDFQESKAKPPPVKKSKLHSVK